MSTSAPLSTPASARVRHLRLVEQPALREQTGQPAREEHGAQAGDSLTLFVQAIAVAIFEVIEGTRRAATLSKALNFGALRDLGALAALRREQLTVLRLRPRQVHGAGRVRIDRSLPDVAEAATVVEVGARARAVAMRLEWSHGRWRVSELAVL